VTELLRLSRLVDQLPPSSEGSTNLGGSNQLSVTEIVGTFPDLSINCRLEWRFDKFGRESTDFDGLKLSRLSGFVDQLPPSSEGLTNSGGSDPTSGVLTVTTVRVGRSTAAFERRVD